MGLLQMPRDPLSYALRLRDGNSSAEQSRSDLPQESAANGIRFAARADQRGEQ